MKQYGRIWSVYRKELIETLRDRRTLIAMVVVPIVLYPALMVVLVEALRSESGREAQEHYLIAVPDEAHRQWLEGVLAREDAEREKERAEAEQAAQSTGEDLDQNSSPFRTRIGADRISINVAPPGQSLWDLVSEEQCHAAVLVRPSPKPETFADDTNRTVQIIYCDTRPLSDVLFRQLDRILEDEARRVVKARVAALTGSAEVLAPIQIDSLSTASPDRQFAKILAMIVPFLLVTMTVTGALYPAIDLTAGERERGTLETLAVSPVPVGQIVAGKFGVIVTIAMATTALNLASMTAVLHFSGIGDLFAAAQSGRDTVAAESHTVADAGDGQGATAGLTQRDYRLRRSQIERETENRVGFVTTAAPIVLLAMVPFAVLFGAVMLAVCSFARTFKEAQNYMMPVMMAAIVPAMVVSYMPTVKLAGTLTVIPVANMVLLMRELFLGHYDVAALAICLISTCFYAAVAVIVATRVYGNEAVLFSDVGNYKTLILRRFIQPQTYPTAAVALVAVAIVFPLNFYMQSSLISREAGAAHNQWIIAASQVLLFAAPALLLAWYLKLDLRRTFCLRLPTATHTLAAALLALSIVPISNLLQQAMFSWFPPTEATQRLLQEQAALFTGSALWTTLLAFALLPAICEELLFRGWLLAGLRDRLSGIQAILVVGLVFGLFHVQIEKIPIVSLMGMLLTLVCLRTGSIFLAMLVHVANNALAIAAGKIESLRNFLGLPPDGAELGTIHFDARLGIFLVMFVIAVVLLTRSGRAHGARPRGDLQN